ncbi:ethionine resistance protein [Coemansia javaensis]|uniref:Ethionine resistance protein n=1 Tax=Coemansia javaensis TaxID=2761396 RepID=A0A9W8LHH2_9FUNG|nr:ethionine resistance protein [Coemansia javaensis]
MSAPLLAGPASEPLAGPFAGSVAEPLVGGGGGSRSTGGPSADGADLGLDELLLAASVRRETGVLLRLSLPVVLSAAMQLLAVVPLMSAVGGLGTVALASMNLVSIYAGLCGAAAVSGLPMALDSLCSQAFTAASDRRVLGVYLQRVLVALALVLAALYPLWWNAQAIYQRLGVPADIARATGRILRVYFFGMAGAQAYECLKSYLFAQGLRRFAVVAQGASLPVAWLCIWLFVSNERTSLGVLGVPCVTVAAVAVYNLATLAAMARAGGGRACWGGWSRAALSGLGQVFRLGAAGSATALFDSMSLHMVDVGALFLDAPSMAAQAVLSLVLTCFWLLGTSFGVSACNRIGNLLGAGHPNRTLLGVYTALAMAAAAFVTLCALLIGNGRAAAGVFSDDPEVADAIAAHIVWPAVGGAVQGISMAAAGVLRGQGRQALTARMRIASFVCVGVPVSAAATAGLHWGLAGLWLGYVAGAALAMVGQVYAVLSTDWDSEIELCQRRIQASAIPGPHGGLEDTLPYGSRPGH